MKIGKTIYFKSRNDFRKWLSENHKTKQELWLGFYKVKAMKGWLAYSDAVEEALCYGWIDGILKKIDDERHVIRFSARRKNSVWADSNIARVRKLIKQKKCKKQELT